MAPLHSGLGKVHTFEKTAKILNLQNLLGTNRCKYLVNSPPKKKKKLKKIVKQIIYRRRGRKSRNVTEVSANYVFLLH